MFHWLKHPEPKKKQMDCVIIYYCCIAIYLDCRHSPDVKTASFAAFSFSDRPSAKYASKSSSNSFSLFSFCAVGFFFFASETDPSLVVASASSFDATPFGHFFADLLVWCIIGRRLSCMDRSFRRVAAAADPLPPFRLAREKPLPPTSVSKRLPPVLPKTFLSYGENALLCSPPPRPLPPLTTGGNACCWRW